MNLLVFHSPDSNTDDPPTVHLFNLKEELFLGYGNLGSKLGNAAVPGEDKASDGVHVLGFQLEIEDFLQGLQGGARP